MRYSNGYCNYVQKLSVSVVRNYAILFSYKKKKKLAKYANLHIYVWKTLFVHYATENHIRIRLCKLPLLLACLWVKQDSNDASSILHSSRTLLFIRSTSLECNRIIYHSPSPAQYSAKHTQHTPLLVRSHERHSTTKLSTIPLIPFP